MKDEEKLQADSMVISGGDDGGASLPRSNGIDFSAEKNPAIGAVERNNNSRIAAAGSLRSVEEEISERLRPVYDIGCLFLSDGSLETVISRSFEMTGDYLKVNRIYLSCITNKRSSSGMSRSLTIRNCWNGDLMPGSDPPLYAQAGVSSEENRLNESFDKDGLWLIVDDVSEIIGMQELTESARAENIMAFMSVPVIISGEFWGIITIDSASPRKWCEQDIQYARFAAEGLGNAIKRSDAQREIIIAKEKALRAKEQAEYYSKIKSDFIAWVGASMRSPVNTIISMAGMANDSLDNNHRNYCNERIRISGKDMLRAINHIRDMVEIERGDYKLNYSEINLIRLLRNISESVKKKAEAKGVIFSMNIGRLLPTAVVGDESNIKKVLYNLLYNALEYTPEHGEIRFSADKISENETSFILGFEIADNGIGMTQEQMDGLGTAFYKIGRRNENDIGHGVGLGLFISMRIVELMDGEIEVESKPGRGSHFKCRMKLIKAADNAVRKNPSGDLLFCDEGDKGLLFVDTDIMNGDMPWIKRNSDVVGLLPGKVEVDATEVIKASKDGFDGSLCGGCISFDGERCLGGENFGEGSCRAAGIFRSAGINTEMNDDAFMSKRILRRNFAGKHFLLAEDDYVSKEVVENILEGAHIDWVEDGKSAIEKYSSCPNKYDLILMDLKMPYLDGIKVAKLIRESKLPGSETIPIIAVSGDSSDEVILRCFEAGMNDHVTKPMESDVLIAAVNIQLSRS